MSMLEINAQDLHAHCYKIWKWIQMDGNYDTFKQRINIFDSQGTRENNHLTLMISDTS